MHTSAQVISKLASLDIPAMRWPELVHSLFNNMTRESSKEGALVTLGYICEEVSYEIFGPDEADSILEVILENMKQSEEKSAHIGLAATKALFNALEFAKTNFEDEKKRSRIMEMVYEATLSEEAEIRKTAFECLGSIVSVYYEKLEKNMDRLFRITSNAIECDEDSVGLQAIEVLSSICDKEIDLQELNSADTGYSSPPHSGLIEMAVTSLVPLLLQTLLKPEEDLHQDDDTWNIPMAGGTCLGLVLRTVGDAVTPLVTAFVIDKINEPDRRSHKAAAHASRIIKMEITPLLKAALSVDVNVRTGAEKNLRQLQEQDLPMFLQSLTFELANECKLSETRRLAGIMLKNSLEVAVSETKENLGRKAVDTVIKRLLLKTLGSPAREARHTSAQVISKLASLDIPAMKWPGLGRSLFNNMTRESSKEGALVTLGYICEEVSYEIFGPDEADSILEVILENMKQSEEKSAHIGLAATEALFNALEFAKTNFEDEKKRSRIMEMVLEAAFSEEAKIRKAAVECLVWMVTEQYRMLLKNMVLEKYMEKLVQLTSIAVNGREESVTLLAIELWRSICENVIQWSSVCDEVELDKHYAFIRCALPHFVPLLLQTLPMEVEHVDDTWHISMEAIRAALRTSYPDLDDDLWNVSMASRSCLCVVAKAVGDSIIPIVESFIKNMMLQPRMRRRDWRIREVPVYALGSILDGPAVDKLAPLISSHLELLLNAAVDVNEHVRYTAFWTMSRIFELRVPNSGRSVIPFPPDDLRRIVPVLTAIKPGNMRREMKDIISGAIYNLAKSYTDDRWTCPLLEPYVLDMLTYLSFCLDGDFEIEGHAAAKIGMHYIASISETARKICEEEEEDEEEEE